jgi:hypothetical protein
MRGPDRVDDMAQIEQAEARLRDAMLTGDVAALDDVLSEALVFTNQAGTRLGKADDIAAHRSGLLRIERLDPREQPLVRLLGDGAIVCVTVDLAGSYGDQPFAGWLKPRGTGSRPQVVSTSATQAGTRSPAGPSRLSSNHALPADGSKFSSSVCAPAALAAWTKPAAG